MTHHRFSLQRRQRRPGFTLIELLVVIAIILVLMSLLLVAVFRMMSVPPVKNTQLTVMKVYDALKNQWRAVATSARDTTNIPSATWQGLMTQAGGDPQVARELYVRMRLQQEFPQNAAEATKASYAGVAAAPAKYHGAILLFLALRQDRGITVKEEGFSPAEVRTEPSSGMQYLADAWGEPLQYISGLPGTPTVPIEPFIASSGPNMTGGDADDITSANLRPGDY